MCTTAAGDLAETKTFHRQAESSLLYDDVYIY